MSGGRDVPPGKAGAEGPGEEGRDLPGPRRPRGPTRREALRGVRRELEAAGVESPGLEAERLLAHAVGTRRPELALTGEEVLSPEEAGRLAGSVRRRLAGEPLQHIEGTVEFRGLVLAADRRALIPRPETEQLVERVVQWARARSAAGGPGVRVAGRPAAVSPPLRSVLDIGTGSGAIALSLVAVGVAARAIGVDVSADALAQAAENRARAGLREEEVEFRLAARPVWTAVSPKERFTAIVSNPPYVAEAELEELSAEVREHEPTEALAGGADGLDVIREVAAKAHLYLEPDGALFLEVGAGQGAAVRQLFESSGNWDAVAVERDLAGRDRFVRAERG